MDDLVVAQPAFQQQPQHVHRPIRGCPAPGDQLPDDGPQLVALPQEGEEAEGHPRHGREDEDEDPEAQEGGGLESQQGPKELARFQDLEREPRALEGRDREAGEEHPDRDEDPAPQDVGDPPVDVRDLGDDRLAERLHASAGELERVPRAFPQWTHPTPLPMNATATATRSAANANRTARAGARTRSRVPKEVPRNTPTITIAATLGSTKPRE